ncbi:putative MFS family arabinose efflux permease [Hydrogenispora ethanolica]|uniref:Putative MFS family arabinose efflux permease n=1 Tax=Hydrogenispora ethanolica TaxID=1082276 RepID=A0A4R1R8N0_HYDET|nr:MFS transporter [Hydrogenispora ethanolica]TCL62025.1 putative MFS family arabinose efflux permease [Hydrogenispora ethanolica]
MPEPKERLFAHPVILSFLAIIAAIEFIRMSLFLTLLPSFLTSIHFSTVALGVVMSANLLTDNLFKSGSGWLVDHKGPWPMLIAGTIGVLSGLVLIEMFHRNILMMSLGAVLLGLGASPTWPAAIAGTIRITGEEKRATMISFISVVWLAGGGAGPILMGFLIDTRLRLFLQKLHLPVIDAYRTGFVLLTAIAVLAVLIAVLGWLGWKRIPRLQPVKAGMSEGKRQKLKAVLQRLWDVKGLIPGMFFQTMSLGILFPNILRFAVNKIGITEAQYSVLLLIGGAVVVLFMIPVGHLADHWGTKGFLVAGFTMASLSLLVLVSYGNARNIWWIGALVGLSYSLIQPAWNALLAGAIPPEHRGVLMGLFMSVEGLGFGLGPLVGGFLGEVQGRIGGLTLTGLTTPFYVSSICLAIMALVYLIYPFHQYQLREEA